MSTLFSHLRLHFLLLALFGGAYPFLILALGRLMPDKAEGRTVSAQGRVAGFSNIGQANDLPGYFHPRPSAVAYNAAAAGGSNKGPTNPQYLAEVRDRAIKLRQEHSMPPDSPVPADLVTASGSGIDPDISPEAAHYQARRVANARHLSEQNVRQLIDAHAHSTGIGPAYVNVLALNLALDGLTGIKP